MKTNGYTVVGFVEKPETGFSATIFQKDGKNILSIRGSEDYYDYLADAAVLDDKVLPYAQFQSLVDYVASSGLSEFDVTGHSLGGLLAQVAKATFSGRVKDVYTFNALGAKDLQQFVYKGVDEQGNIKLEYPPVQGQTWPSFSFKWPPSVYAAYQAFFANQKSSETESHVYNITGGIWSTPLAGIGTDIGPEVFTACSGHGIEAMAYSLQLGKCSIDPHKPVTFVGSKADEIIDGLSLTGTSITNPIQPLTLMGGYGNDKLYGSDGNDTLYGDMAPEVPTATTGNSGPEAKAGNDHLYGGRGNDTLVGGEGDDVYHIRYGEGNDTIDDTSGENTIVYTDGNGMSRTLKFFYSSSSGSWTTPDGKATLSGNTITMEDGQTITLSGGTDLENFGIHKQDKPEDTENFNAIPGEDSKNDTLFDTAGNDKIEGKSGCDIIAVLHGANDWVLGGADDDDISVKADLTGNILIEGNAGMDMIAGGGGNDRIFCENKGEMVDLVEAGETAENLDIWGERANGMGGNDFIYGSQAKDLLLGGTGSDLVVGGSGDDALFGDGDAVFLGPASWSITVDGDVFSITMENGELMDATVGGDDVIYGGNGNDWIAGQGGDDEISAGAGNDYAFGDAGNDAISGGEGNDIIKGDNFSIAAGFHGDDYIDGGAGDDRIWGDGGSDIIDGGAGNDEIYGDDRIVGLADQGDDYIDGGDGNDRIFGQGGNDVVFGGKGEDLIEGDGLAGPGNDYIDGGDDNDKLIGAGGNDIIFGGAGNDVIAGDSDDTPLDDQGDDYMSGGEGDDQIIGYRGNDVAFGGAGNDQIWGELGDDIIGGEEGDDELSGGEGNDGILGGAGNDQIWGGTGDDVIGGDEGDDTIQADDGNDTISGGSGNDVLLGAAGNDTILGDEGNDQLQGDAGNDYLDGGAGNDTLVGLSGNDDLYGGDGSDQIWGGDGSDTINGGAGNDEIAAEAGNDILDGAEGDDLLHGGTGSDTYIFLSGNDTIQEDDWNGGTSINKVNFGAGILQADLELSRVGNNLKITIMNTTNSLTINDWFTSSGEIFPIDQFIFDDGTIITGYELTQRYVSNYTGTPQNDTLQGTNFADFIDGQGGNDTLSGYKGNDTLIGGVGNDTLRGGAGFDRYIFNLGDGSDVIEEDFDPYSEDTNVLELRGGIIPGDVTISRNVSGSFLLTIAGTTDQITIPDWGFPKIQRIEFADGTVWSGAEIQSRIYPATEGNDRIYGSNDSETILGLGGNDTIYGGRGHDILDGGDGNDELSGGDGGSTLRGGAGDDRLYGGTGDDFMEGGGGNDTLISGEGINVLDGGAGNDRFSGTYGANDTYLGGEGDDVMLANDSASAQMMGGMGDDTYRVGNVNSIVIENADEGFDTVISDLPNYTLTANVEKLDLDSYGGNGIGNALDNIMEGNNGSNHLDGGAGNDEIRGNRGNDFLEGGSGDDLIEGGDGSDTCYGGTGDDYLSGGTGSDTLDGGAGNDSLGCSDSQGNDTYIFGRGYGNDDINDYDATLSNTDTIALGNDIAPSDIRLTRQDDDLILSIRGTDDKLKVYRWFNDTDKWKVERIQFADDTVWDVAYIEAHIMPGGTEGDDILTGTACPDVLEGLGGNDQLSGYDGDDLLDGGSGDDTMLGGLGNDMYVVDATGDVVTENANEGIDTIQSSVIYTLGNNIENLTLTENGNINGTGNGMNNVLTGNAGNNTLDGNTGMDMMSGGSGNDTYVVDNAGDIVTENANEGTDTVRGSVTYTLGANVENLTLTGSAAINGMGNALDNILTGNSGANSLTGGAGNDTLDGGAANDTMMGGSGNDTYIVNATGDVVMENTDEGTDMIRSSVTYTLGNNVENLTLTGTSAINGTGNTLDNILTGNSAANTLTGGAGNDTLDGGAGNDTMRGGLGDDIYVVGSTGDIVTENANEGTDTVLSSVTYTLGNNIENLTLTGTAAINATGNTLNNVLTGNAGNNKLDGKTGADNMIGGAGNDTYVVDNVGDTITENADEGTDLVQSSVTYTLENNIENLTLTGTSAINGTGNALDNALIGNSGANTLTGGAGNDTMVGGIGNDIYVVGSTGDVVTENANEGIDMVRSSVTYTLVNNVENLTLSGTSAINGTGNALDNVLTGNSAANTLDGGAGNDTMRGGLGDDIYVVGSTGDAVTENANEGTDTVQSSVTYTLGNNVENLTLTGSTAINGTGNDLNNVLIGNSAVNTLTGNDGNDTLDGHTGNDSLTGGNGSDTYVFRRTDGIDTVTETAGVAGDTDTVRMTDGISQSEPVIVKQNNDLYLFIDDNNYMKINSEFSQMNYGIERLEVSDGYYITRTDIENIVNTMSAINNDPGMDVMAKYNAMRVDQTYISTLAQSWHQP